MLCYTDVVSGTVKGVEGNTVHIRSHGETWTCTVDPLPTMRIDDHICVVMFRNKVLALSNFTTGTEQFYRVTLPDGPYRSDTVNSKTIIDVAIVLSGLGFFFGFGLYACATSGGWGLLLLVALMWVFVFCWLVSVLNRKAADVNAKVDAAIQEALINAAADPSALQEWS